jgi:hypothetical protein
VSDRVAIGDKFCHLFRGNALAKDTADGEFRPWRGEDGTPMPASGLVFQEAIHRHLWGPYRLGVYPLMEVEGSPSCNVGWLAVDWDEGDISLVHAVNVRELLAQLDITSWVETSRSKGFHLWVFLEEDIPAQMGRNAMFAACQIVDSPTREVYPKQVTMPAKGFGNGIRLPYALSRPEGRQEAVRGSESNLTLEEFTAEAFDSMVTRQQIVKIASLYQPAPSTRPIHTPKFTQRRVDADFRFVARDIWDQGPSHNDRSLALFSFACSLFRQLYSPDAVLEWTRQCDLKWGQKFAARGPQGEQQLRKLVDDAGSKMGR